MKGSIPVLGNLTIEWERRTSKQVIAIHCDQEETSTGHSKRPGQGDLMQTQKQRRGQRVCLEEATPNTLSREEGRRIR